MFISVSSRVSMVSAYSLFFLVFPSPATTRIYTLSLHDALPISELLASDSLKRLQECASDTCGWFFLDLTKKKPAAGVARSEEHTSELQSHSDLVCRLLLEKKKIAAAAREIIVTIPKDHFTHTIT